MINKLVKTCSRCNQVLPISDFYRDRNTITGHMYHCKICDRIIKKDFLTKKNKWNYKGDEYPIRDPEYLKDRKKLFDEHGGGWWWGLDDTKRSRYPSGREKPKKMRGIGGKYKKRDQEEMIW